jgi:hypothetical protein
MKEKLEFIMNKKVVSYELCKRLDELGFEGKSHCGWWSQVSIAFSLSKQDKYEWTKTNESIFKYAGIKAYDCWDLLMWLNQNDYETSLESWTDFHVEAPGAIFTQAEEPQSALALAIIKILEEK